MAAAGWADVSAAAERVGRRVRGAGRPRPPVTPETVDAAVLALFAFAAGSTVRRLDAVGVTMDDP